MLDSLINALYYEDIENVFGAFMLILGFTAIVFFLLGMLIERRKYIRYARNEFYRAAPVRNAPSNNTSVLNERLETISQCQINEMSDIKMMQFDLSAIKAKQIEHTKLFNDLIDLHKKDDAP